MYRYIAIKPAVGYRLRFQCPTELTYTYVCMYVCIDKFSTSLMAGRCHRFLYG